MAPIHPRTIRSLVLALLLLESSGCATSSSQRPSRRPFVECNSTDTCRAQIQARDSAFAKVVADEPPATRIDVEVVTRIVFLDLQKQTVYTLDPVFTALELQTGREKQRIDGVSGDSLWRVGTWLVVSDTGAKQFRLTFIDPAKPDSKPTTCSPTVPIPKEAAGVETHPFDRAGQPYFYWHSFYHYVGGVPPGAQIVAQKEKAEACGVMRLDLATCTAQSVPLDDFLWEPPEGRRQRKGEKDFCRLLSPLRDIPAIMASAPRAPAGWGQLAPASRAPMLAVRAEKEPGNACSQVTRLTLEARNEASAALWTHPLAPVVNTCGPP